jgi:thioredoxin 2
MTSTTRTIVTCPQCGKKNRVPAAAAGTPRCANCGAALPWIVDAGDDDFADIVHASSVPVLVDLWAPWCGPCRMVSPALERLATEYAGRVKLVKVNVDSAPKLSERFGVQGIPMLLLMDHDRVVSEQVGAQPEAALRSWLEQGLARIAHTAPDNQRA